MFTINPLNGDPSVIVIESSWGLGEAVVKGEVNPDRYIINKPTLEILRKEVSKLKNVAYYVSDSGRVEGRELTGVEACCPTLGDDEARHLAEIGRRIERHYSSPRT